MGILFRITGGVRRTAMVGCMCLVGPRSLVDYHFPAASISRRPQARSLRMPLKGAGPLRGKWVYRSGRRDHIQRRLHRPIFPILASSPESVLI